MKRYEWHPEHGPLVAMTCRCSVWPIGTLGRIGRCGECGERPVPIPEYDSLIEVGA